MSQRWQDAKLPDAEVPRLYAGMSWTDQIHELIRVGCLTVVGSIGPYETRAEHEARISWDGCHCGNGFCE